MDAVYNLSVSSDAGLLQLSVISKHTGISLVVLKHAVSCAGSLPSVSSEELTRVLQVVKNTGVRNTIRDLFTSLEYAEQEASWLSARNKDLVGKLGKQVEKIVADFQQKGLPHPKEKLACTLELSRFKDLKISSESPRVILGLLKQQHVASKKVSELEALNEQLESLMECVNKETEWNRHNSYLRKLNDENPGKEMAEYLLDGGMLETTLSVSHASFDGKLSPASKKCLDGVSSTRSATATADQDDEARDEDVLGELPSNHQVQSSVDHA